MKRIFRKLAGKKKLESPLDSSPLGNLHILSPTPPEQIDQLLARPLLSGSSTDVSDLLRVRVKAICLVCYNLDARNVHHDNLTEPSWASLEYNVRPDIISGKLTIYDSRELLATANRGCLFCGIVAHAIERFCADWRTEASHAEIYVAIGLPIRVKLIFSSATVWKPPNGRLIKYSSEINVPPEYQHHNLIMKFADARTEEVEIYRPMIGEKPRTVGDAAAQTLTQEIGYAREIADGAGDASCFTFIQHHLGVCLTEHQCRVNVDGAQHPNPPLLPSRVIWCGENDNSNIRLVEPVDTHAHYIALSYCWGPQQWNIYKTTASTLASRKTGIRHQDLPPLFRDVVRIARMLGIPYIWIDRLCILQGDDSDFKLQAPKMGEIYGQATLTISAGSATTEQDRILISRDPERASVPLKIKVGNMGSVQLGVRKAPYTLGSESKGGEYGKSSTRAWIWQERLLSARTIIFTPTAIKFECRRTSCWEGFYRDHAGHSWSSQLDQASQTTWGVLVEEYTKRDITRDSDRLPAISSAMKRIETARGWSGTWGIWENALAQGMAWTPAWADGRRAVCQMTSVYCAPTWSWASVQGHVFYEERGLPWERDKPWDWDIAVQHIDRQSGVLTISGRIYARKIHAIYRSYETGHTKTDYSISTSSNIDETRSITEDVALKLCKGNFQDPSSSVGIIRVPYGEKPPAESWSGDCLGLLLGHQGHSCFEIFLGRSQRVRGAWERIGSRTTELYSNIPHKISSIQIA